MGQAEIVDGTGSLVGYTIPGDLSLYQDEKVAEWAFQVHEKALAWPVTIRYPFAYVA
jgi:hypothetical protein